MLSRSGIDCIAAQRRVGVEERRLLGGRSLAQQVILYRALEVRQRRPILPLRDRP